MIAVAVGWQMYDLTRSALALGFVGLAQFTPMLLLVLVAGHVVDRFERRHVARACHALAAAAMLVLCVATAEGATHPLLLYATVAVIGSCRSFESPAQSALLPNVVPPELIAPASARVSTAQQISTVGGPALAGLLYAVHPAIPYAIAVAMYATAFACMTFLRTRGTSARTSGPPTRESLFAGMVFIRHTPIVAGAITLDLFAVLLGGATALLPVYARDILVTGPWGLGLLRAAPAAGALAVSLAMGRRPVRRRLGQVMFASVATFGLGTIAFGVSHSFAVSFFALAVLGGADVISVVIRSTLVALLTPDVMRGRVNAVNALFIGTSNQLGEFESGATAALLGPVGAVVLGGLGTLAVAAACWKAFPSLARIDSLADIESNVSLLASKPAAAT